MAAFDPHMTTMLRDDAREPPGPPPLPPAAAILAASSAKATAGESDGDEAPNPLQGLLGEYRCVWRLSL